MISSEVARGLVRQQQYWIADQGAGDRHPLLFAARQVGRIGIHTVLKSDPFQYLERSAALFHAWLAQHLRHEGNVLENRACGNQLEILEHEPDSTAILLNLAARELVQTVAVDEDFALARALLHQQQPEKRRLTRTARAGKKHELAFGDGQRQVAKRV